MPEPTAAAPSASRDRLELAGSLAVLLLAAIALLSDALFSSRVLSAGDALLAFQPWKQAAPPGHVIANPLLLDQPIVCEPWLDLAAEQLRAGELPLWNPYDYCGQPYHAAASGGFASPLNWPYFAFPGPATKEWAGLLRLFLAGAFALFWLRCFALSAYARLLGALCFQLGGFMVAWLGHPHTAAAVFLPFLLWRIERALDGSSWRAAGTIGLGSGLAWLAGHAQTAAHIALATSLYALWRGAQQRVLARALVACACGQVLGLAVGLVQLWPQWEYLRGSQAALVFARVDVTSPLALLEAARFLLAPLASGAPQHGDYQGPLGHNLNYAELIGGYIGVLPLALAALALTRLRTTRAVRVLAGLAALALLVAWQVPPLYELARGVPVLASTKLLRLLLVACAALSALAAFGLDRALELARLRGRAAAIAAAAAVLLATVDLLHVGRGFNPAIERALIAPETEVTRFLRSDRSTFRVLAVDNTALLANANVFHRIASISGYDSLEDERLVALVSLLSNDPAAGLDAVAGAVSSERPPGAWFIKEVRAFDRIEALPVGALLNAKYVLAPDALPEPFVLRVDGPLKVYENPLALPRAFASTSFRFVDPPRRNAGGWLELDRNRMPDAARVELERASSNASDPAFAAAEPDGAVEPRLVPCELVEHGAHRVIVRVAADQRCCVVLSDTFAPGWTASVDGAPAAIHRAFGALRGVVCPAGEHRIEFRYEPRSVRIGLWVSALAALGCLLLAVGFKRRASEDARSTRLA